MDHKMPEAEMVEDANGKTMELFRTKLGRLVAGDWVMDTVDNMPELPLRSDDVMLCSYAKSGCHWMWEVLRYLKFRDLAGLDQVDKESYMVEFNTFDHLAALRSPRVLNNHGFFDEQPRDLVKKKVKVVFIHRNPKDVAVSFYHHHIRFEKYYKYNDTFSNYLRRFEAGLVDNSRLFDYLRSWEEGILNTPGLDIHIVRYEDMKKDPLKEIRGVSKFLGTSDDDEFLETIARDTDFEAMRARKAQQTVFLDEQGNPIMYRKGQVGDWKNHFTVAESEWMDSVIEKELGDSKLFQY